MNFDKRLTVSPSVVAREVGGEMMLMDLESGTYFGLDAVGGRIWQALEDGQQMEQLVEQLENEFEVAPDQLRMDIASLFQDLLEHKLVTEAPAQP